MNIYNPLTKEIISLKQAAEIANLSPSHLSRMLRGKIKNSTIFKIVNENSESEPKGEGS